MFLCHCAGWQVHSGSCTRAAVAAGIRAREQAHSFLSTTCGTPLAPRRPSARRPVRTRHGKDVRAARVPQTVGQVLAQADALRRLPLARHLAAAVRVRGARGFRTLSGPCARPFIVCLDSLCMGLWVVSVSESMAFGRHNRAHRTPAHVPNSPPVAVTWPLSPRRWLCASPTRTYHR